MTRKNQIDLQTALHQFEEWPSDSCPALQRRFRRFPVRGEARLWPGVAMSMPPIPLTVQVRDISRGGVGLLSNEPVETGSFWRLQLIQSDVSIMTLPAFCRCCCEVAGGGYLLGMEFGVEASVMLALGVPAKELAAGDEMQALRALTADFVDPGSLAENEAA